LRKAHRIFIVFLGTGLGFGITSSTIFLWLVIFGQPNSYYFLTEFSIVLLLFLLAKQGSSSSRYPQTIPIIVTNDNYPKVEWLKYLFFLLLFFSMGSFALKAFLHDPHGKFDAWLMWNLKARLLYYGGNQWSYAFSKDLMHTSPDYPLLLSASIYRIWLIIGTDNIAVPIIIAGFFTFGSIILIQQGLSIIRGQNHGYLAAIFMLIATQYIKLGTYQYADIPLAFFILSTIILLSLKEIFPLASLRMMFLAGLAASSAGWTKNEGLLFLAMMILVLIVINIINKQLRGKKEFFFFLLGLIPIFSTEIFFKLRFATPNDLVNSKNLSLIFSYLMQLGRYQQILIKFVEKLLFFNDGIVSIMFVYLLFSGLDKNFFNRKTLAPLVTLLGLLLCGYFFLFLISPYNLKWHLNSSLYRLVIHVWPSFVYLFFLCAKEADRLTINEKPN
jgi:hypothetical protein